jgi:hypothetical protein
MTIAVLTEASDHGVFTYSCPARHLVARRGSFVLWPQSEKPIRVPYAWCYSLHFEELRVGGDPE